MGELTKLPADLLRPHAQLARRQVGRTCARCTLQSSRLHEVGTVTVFRFRGNPGPLASHREAHALVALESRQESSTMCENNFANLF